MKFEIGALKARLKHGIPTFFGCVMDCRTGMVMEAYKDAGLDTVMIDREHTCLDPGQCAGIDPGGPFGRSSVHGSCVSFGLWDRTKINFPSFHSRGRFSANLFVA